MSPSRKPTRYAELGVDVKKKGIEVFKRTVKSLFPRAFCVITDSGLPGYGSVLHTDSAGSKPIQSYLHWRETGDLNWFKELAQDVVAMNLDDVICVGAGSATFVDYVAINGFRIPKEDFLAVLNLRFAECFALLKKFVKVSFAGGETADLPDQLRTLDVSGAINAQVKLSEVISGEEVKPGDVIIGLRSGGKTKYEKSENSGLMCNGITLARHCLMKREYGRKYPEIKDPSGKGYYGRFAFDDHLDELGMTVGEAIISPTRLFAPVVAKILERYRAQITGLVHNTGGGQTKCLRIGRNIHYVKNEPIRPDPIFDLIHRESKESWRAMFENFNMGTGFEIVAKESYSDDILSVSEKLGLEAKVIGRCEKGDGRNKLTIRSEFGKFKYG